MIGKLLSTITKVVTLPIDIANSGMDMLCGNDGSKKSRTQDTTPGALLENLRDETAKTLEEFDR